MSTPFEAGQVVLREKIKTLVGEVAEGRQAELISELVETALMLGHDRAGIADLKLLRRAFKEMRKAAKLFAGYSDKRKVSVFGSARTKPEAEEYKVAVEFAQRIVQEGFMVVTGGGDGIMGAAQVGAGAANSFGLNIRLPFEQRANETIHGDPKLINFNYFFTRKLSFMKESHAFVLLPGGFGTQDEGFECLTLMQTGKTQVVPVILLDRPNGYYWETWRRFLDNDLLENGLISSTDFNLFRISYDVDDVVKEILKFYSVFHSYRWVREEMVVRLNQTLTPAALESLNDQFVSLLASGKIVQQAAHPEEKEETHLAHLSRLVLTPRKRDFGRIRLLINEINNSATA
ncbi:MAG TPA: TIGR00730 family Rossman fold protein [Chthoniobacterales bacterium]